METFVSNQYMIKYLVSDVKIYVTTKMSLNSAKELESFVCFVNQNTANVFHKSIAIIKNK